METNINNLPIVYFDTETTGINDPRLIQIALSIEDKDSSVTVSEYYMPTVPIETMAMATHHITLKTLKGYATFKESMNREETVQRSSQINVCELIKKYASNAVWIAHNAPFDVLALKNEGIELKYVIDTLKVARAVLHEGGNDLESYSLQYLRYYLELYKRQGKNIIAHDAFSDVFVLKDLVAYLQKFVDIQEMYEISNSPMVIRNINFGQYRGMRLADLTLQHTDYVEWLITNPGIKESYPDLIYSLNKIINTPKDGENNSTNS